MSTEIINIEFDHEALKKKCAEQTKKLVMVEKVLMFETDKEKAFDEIKRVIIKQDRLD